MRVRVFLALACLCPALLCAAQGTAQPDAVDLLVARIEQAVIDGDSGALRAMFSFQAGTPAIDEFVNTMTAAPVSSATVKERDRASLSGGGTRLMLEIFTDRRGQGVVSTWRADAYPSHLVPGAWQIVALERLTVITGLYQLALNDQKSYAVHNLVVRAPDLTLDLPVGRAFSAETPEGTTAVVLLGRGKMTFTPQPPAEQVQVRIFCGNPSLSTEFSSVFLRLNPGEFQQHFGSGALTPIAPDADTFKKADQIFDTYAGQSFQIDLSDLSANKWSLLPTAGDFVAEITTKKFGSLTYARSSAEAEDISLFDRRRRRNISVYASPEKLAARGRFYSDDDARDYQVDKYEIEAAFTPERLWIDGVARLNIRVTGLSVTTLPLRLANSLVVRNVYSDRFGRLLHLRVVGQDSVLVGLPGTLPQGEELQLTIVYGGRLTPQSVDREAIQLGQDQEEPALPLEPRYLYSNRSYWYPQAPVTGYAPATLKLSVPPEFGIVASGVQQGPPVLVPAKPNQRPSLQFVFATPRPARYLACIISRFDAIETAQLNLPSSEDSVSRAHDDIANDGGGSEVASVFNLLVRANPRQLSRARSLSDRTADILKFYTSLIGEAPYSSFTLAVTESELPGGHSPAYFAILNQPLPSSPLVWRNDPVAFDNYPSFFLAHEVAHQWWGQAVGWKNYHEQWLSEGFAQYFAALYAERERGPELFAAVMRQMRHWAMDDSVDGPVYLGYRLGHIQGNSRIFRAIVYDKAAVVLHMLRRLVGDQAFFTGLRDFYTRFRYKKAGTDDFRVTMEEASGQRLSRFFEDWIYGSAIPRVKFSSTITAAQATLRFEQQSAEPFDFPVTVSILYRSGDIDDVVVPVTDRVVTHTVALKGAVKSIEVNRDNAALVEVVR